MKSYKLNFWEQNTGSTSNPLIPANSIQRVYFNAEDGTSLGYFQMKVSVEYGNVRNEERFYTTTLPADAITKLFNELEVESKDSFCKFNALVRRSNGIKTVSILSGEAKKKQEAEIKKLKKYRFDY